MQGISRIQPFSVKIRLENIRKHNGLQPNSLRNGAGKFLPVQELFEPDGVAVKWVEFPFGPPLLESAQRRRGGLPATPETRPPFSRTPDKQTCSTRPLDLTLG